nr:retrotransposon protein, putative, unclassified [Tanacetum cinerariifolium]
MLERPKLDEDFGGKPVDPTRYRGMVGFLMYLSTSRPDIVFAVCMCARYQAKPTEKHLHAVKRIFKYLKGTIHMGLCVQHSRSKHIDIRHHFIKEQVERRIVELYFVETKYQLADIFTKALPRERFETLLLLLGVQQMSPETLKKLQQSTNGLERPQLTSESYRSYFNFHLITVLNPQTSKIEGEIVIFSPF